MQLQCKLNQLLKRAKLRHTILDISKFKKSSTGYLYTAHVSRADFLNRYDQPSTSYLNSKIDKFNELMQKEITYAYIRMQTISSISNYDSYIQIKVQATFSSKGEQTCQ